MTRSRIPNAGFTRGPWIDCGDDEADGVPYLVIETDRPTGPDLRVICHVQPEYDDAKDRFFIDEQATANARLIAAAPKMFAFVEASECHCEDGDDQFCRRCALLQEARGEA